VPDGLNGLGVDRQFLGSTLRENLKFVFVRIFSRFLPIGPHYVVAKIPNEVDGPGHGFELLGGRTVFKSVFVGEDGHIFIYIGRNVLKL
jgi:hypothetical protein